MDNIYDSIGCVFERKLYLYHKNFASKIICSLICPKGFNVSYVHQYLDVLSRHLIRFQPGKVLPCIYNKFPTHVNAGYLDLLFRKFAAILCTVSDMLSLLKHIFNVLFSKLLASIFSNDLTQRNFFLLKQSIQICYFNLPSIQTWATISILVYIKLFAKLVFYCFKFSLW